MPVIKENYDVCIVGAGHAGCEAALPAHDWDWKPFFLPSALKA